jgi:hypothetical protein
MMLAVFLLCSSAAASDCSVGVKNDEVFFDRSRCEAYLSEITRRMPEQITAAACVPIKGVGV